MPQHFLMVSDLEVSKLPTFINNNRRSIDYQQFNGLKLSHKEIIFKTKEND